MLSLVWMLVLRYSAGLLAWLVVLVVNILFVAVTLLAFTKARPPFQDPYIPDLLLKSDMTSMC